MTTYEHSNRGTKRSIEHYAAVAAKIVHKLVPHTIITEQREFRPLSAEEERVRKQLDVVPVMMRNMLANKLVTNEGKVVRSQPAQYTSNQDESKAYELRVEGTSSNHLWLARTPIERNWRGKEVANIHQNEVVARFLNGTFSYDWIVPYETSIAGLTIQQQEQRAAHTIALLEIVAEAQ